MDYVKLEYSTINIKKPHHSNSTLLTQKIGLNGEFLLKKDREKQLTPKVTTN